MGRIFFTSDDNLDKIRCMKYNFLALYSIVGREKVPQKLSQTCTVRKLYKGLNDKTF